MKGKTLSFIILPALALLAAACSNGSSGAEAGESGKSLNAPKKPVDLVFYYTSTADWNEESFMRTFGEPIKQKFPHITPKFLQNGKGTSLPELVAAGQQIDVVFVSTGLMSRMQEVELQYDITPLLKKSQFDESAIEPQTLAAGRLIAKGGLYGLPVYTVPATMYYNKDIFDKFGVSYPKDGLTWDDAYQLAAKISRKDGGIKYWGMRASFGHLAHLNQWSMPMVDPATNRSDFGSDKWKSFMDTIQRFYKFADAPNDKNDITLPKQREAFFKTQNVGMWLALTNLHTSPELGSQFNWDIATFPSFSETGNVGPQPYPTYFNITSTSKHKEDALDAIVYLTSKEYQLQKSKEGQLLTVLKDQEVRESLGQEGSLYKGKNVKALLPQKYATPANITKYDSSVRNELEKALFSIILGEKDINTALRHAQDESNKIIETDLNK
ncbi:MAG: extracellular solute-binding protein family 1 [Paenibacillus sp.]|jgi:multiple sugar transport system substrate-binding protein|uniref:ABC transporter substrate-binding protein n=1 Tax=Paenibacillus sp. GCM10012303 TaxID=3317340 RepID=UPI0029EC015D|nr:extracellular solute-binding protein family 1 [Paenibacillus sp.]